VQLGTSVVGIAGDPYFGSTIDLVCFMSSDVRFSLVEKFDEAPVPVP
jgi:hypothetical protein